MTRTLAEFIEHRVGALAYVLLTRRDDIVATDLSGQPELNLLARVTGHGETQMRFFGVILKGSPKLLDEDSASRDLNAYFRNSDKGRGPVQYPFPVLALILSMENDQAFCDWRSEPLAGAGTGRDQSRMEALRQRVATNKAVDAAGIDRHALHARAQEYRRAGLSMQPAVERAKRDVAAGNTVPVANAPLLRFKRTLRCKSFTKSSLDEVVESLNLWYELLFKSFASDAD